MGMQTELALYTSGDKLCNLMFGECVIANPDDIGLKIVERGLGVSATIDFLTRISRGNDLLSELFTVIPILSALHDFMERMPVAKVTDKQFELLLKTRQIV